MVAIFLADGFETVEALAVVDLLRRGGVDICTVSITGKKEVTTSHKIVVMCDKLLDEIKGESLDMMILPGGMPGTLNLEGCQELMEMLDSHYQQGKRIAAICAAPSIFAHKGYLKGKNACSYPNFEKDLEEGGALVSGKPSVKDGNIITGRGMGCAVEFGLMILAELTSDEKAAEIRKAIVSC